MMRATPATPLMRCEMKPVVGADIRGERELALHDREPLGDVVGDALKQKVMRRRAPRDAIRAGRPAGRGRRCGSDRQAGNGSCPVEIGNASRRAPFAVKMGPYSGLGQLWADHVGGRQPFGGRRSPAAGGRRHRRPRHARRFASPATRLSPRTMPCVPPAGASIDFIRAPLCDRLGLPMPFDTGGTHGLGGGDRRPARVRPRTRGGPLRRRDARPRA